MDIFKLQNGSDIRATAIAENGEQVPLNAATAQAIGYGFGIFIKNELKNEHFTVALGRDPRISGEMLLENAAIGLYAAGAEKVYDCGLCTTPAMFVSTKKEYLGVTASAEITASHLPYDKNGFKFFFDGRGADKNDIKKILSCALDYRPTEAVYPKAETYDFLSDYAAGLVEYARKKTGEEKPFAGIVCLVDAGNGSAGFFCEKVLTPLGADSSKSVYLEADGTFPNHIPNPENEEVMASFCEKTLAAKADIGIIFDTDADRTALAENTGRALGKSRLIALASEIALSDTKNATIVTDSVTSTSLTPFIEALGGVHHRFMRGYNNVINEAKRLDKEGIPALLAIETSGHAAMKENDYLDDGAYLALRALIRLSQLKKQGKNFSDLLKNYRMPYAEIELRPQIVPEDFAKAANTIIADFAEFAKTVPGWEIAEPNYEGTRVNCAKGSGDGFILMRMSLHEAVLPINIEAGSPQEESFLKNKLSEFLGGYKNELKGVQL